jgi:hypothetical protein
MQTARKEAGDVACGAMSARILDFPGAPPQLALEGYTLIAWIRSAFDEVGGPGHFWGLWRPSDGRGWYRSGMYYPRKYSTLAPDGFWPGHLDDARNSRSNVIAMYRQRSEIPDYDWHYLETEEQAFPVKRRGSARPPRVRIRTMS